VFVKTLFFCEFTTFIRSLAARTERSSIRPITHKGKFLVWHWRGRNFPFEGYGAYKREWSAEKLPKKIKKILNVLK
jgi:hypothetical protein